MTWPDIVLIVVWLIFIALGARLGSLWVGACLIGGFFGAFLADYYALPVSEMVGSVTVAWVLLYGAGLFAALIPGYVVSRIKNIVFIGLIDSAAGLVTGFFCGMMAIALFTILVVPMFPRIEKTKAWRNSMLVAPIHRGIESFFNQKNFNLIPNKKKIRKAIMNKVEPMAKKGAKEMKKASQDLIEKIGE